MNKVLVTGLGIAREFGICDSCNLDFSWLANNPSTILWADQLYIPYSSFEAQVKQMERKDEKIISLFLNMAEDHGMIKKVDLSDMYQESVGEQIYQKMLTDSQALLKTFPEVIKKGDKGVPNEIIIGEEGYCGAWMLAIYAGIRIARDIGANCLFSKREHNFLKYLYGMESNKLDINNVYSEIFSLYMPEGLAIHNYAFVNEDKCKQCAHYKQCKESYLCDTEQALKKMFKWRDYDELQQAKEEINKIIVLKNEVSSQNDINDIIREFKVRQYRINRNIYNRFPKIKRWTKTTMVLATPLTIASAISGNIPMTVGSAVVTGIAQATENILEIYKNKNNWVGFVNDMKNDAV